MSQSTYRSAVAFLALRERCRKTERVVDYTFLVSQHTYFWAFERAFHYNLFSFVALRLRFGYQNQKGFSLQSLTHLAV